MSENPRLHLLTDLSEQQSKTTEHWIYIMWTDSSSRFSQLRRWKREHVVFPPDKHPNILLLWGLSLFVRTNILALNRSQMISEHQIPHRSLCFFVRGLVCSWASRSEPAGIITHCSAGAPSPSSGGIPGTILHIDGQKSNLNPRPRWI